MSEIEELRKEVREYSRALQGLVIAFQIACTLKLWGILTKTGSMGKVFVDMLGDAPLPSSTSFVLNNAMLIGVPLTLLNIALMVGILKAEKRALFITLGAIFGILTYFLAEMAMKSLYQPIQEIIRQLTG